jgi:hypothetical protein
MGINLEWGGSGRVPLFLGVLLLYAASRSAAGALLSEISGDAPGRRAFAYWIPIAAMALVTIAAKRSDLALAIIFSTSIASLSLVQGAVLLAAPDSEAPVVFRRLWPFVVPVALMSLLAGFAGNLSWWHGIIFLIEGGALYLAWADARGTLPQKSSGVSLKNSANLMLSLLLAIVGAIAAGWGIIRWTEPLATPWPNVLVIGMLGPLLVLPMLADGVSLALRGKAWEATTTSVGVTLLNLCVLLPAVILLWYPVQLLHHNPSAVGEFKALHLKMSPLSDAVPMIFTLITWRVDNVVLLLFAFVLLPPALGRWRLGRSEGTTLIGLYVVYILMEMVAASRS